MLEQLLGIEEQPYSEEDAEWDEFVSNHPHGSVLQTTNWARLKNRFGWRSHRVWLKKDGQLAAGAQILYKSAAIGLVKMGYIPHGPLVDWDDEEQVSVLLNQIDHCVYERRLGLVKMEPFVWQDEISAARWEALCRTHDLLPETDTIQPPQTILIDCRPSTEDILARMKSKTRYNIRLSGKKDITVRRGTEADLPAFIQLMQKTSERDGFGVHTPMYYKDAYDFFAQSGQAVLILAEYETRPLAAVMVFKCGKMASYLYGASSDEERNRMPNYAVQWAAIEWAKEQDCDWYDLWGIPDTTEADLEANFTERHDGLWGVYRFKRGFGGQIKRTVGTTDRVYNNLVHKLYKWRRNR